MELRKIALALAVAAPALSGGAAFAAGPAAPTSWGGGYAGIVGSYAWGNTTANFLAPSNIVNWGAVNMPVNGGLLGGTVGYNFDLQNNWVAGVEGDISFGSISGTGHLDPYGTRSDPGYVPYDTDGKFAQSYFGTLRARLGWSSALMGSPTLWYLTGGFAFSDGTRQIRNTRYPDWSSASEAQAGWVFGGGVEHKFTSHWSFKAELLYADLGKAPYQDPNATVVTQVHLTDTLLRLGLNYKF